MKHWKQEEVEWLKENFEKSKIASVAKKFDRSEKSVMSKVYSLKMFTKPKHDFDEVIIEKLSDGFKQVEIQAELGLTKRQMESYIYKLKKKYEAKTLVHLMLKIYKIR